MNKLENICYELLLNVHHNRPKCLYGDTLIGFESPHKIKNYFIGTN